MSTTTIHRNSPSPTRGHRPSALASRVIKTVCLPAGAPNDQYLIHREALLCDDLANVLPKLGEMPELTPSMAAYADAAGLENATPEMVARHIAEAYVNFVKKLHDSLHAGDDDDDLAAPAILAGDGDDAAAAGSANTRVEGSTPRYLQTSPTVSGPFYREEGRPVRELPLLVGVPA